MDTKTLQDRLLREAEPEYRRFSVSLLPTLDPQSILGVRAPRLRKIAKEMTPTEQTKFLDTLPHTCYEENNLHAYLLSELRDFERCLEEIARFLPFVDNWATCDSLRPKCFGKNREQLSLAIDRWLSDAHPYSVRFGIEMLMVHFLEEAFDPVYLQRVAAVSSEEYYVNMMIAWYFATALAKQYETAIPYLENRRLAPWIHRKAIQKAVESYRISGEHKQYLITLR
ncbi:MAG: DNA alkylation repair protein [Ruminococcaceae bacterium]|nr:DNA alkylation repair protein [Oscillospiraceae bacterium]